MNCGPGTSLDRGYGAALVTNDLTTTPEQLVERDAARRAVEAAFHDARQTLGVGEARNRAQHAPERTIPFGLLAYTVVIVWSTLTGHHPADTDETPHPGPLVHHQDPARLRGHDRQTPPRHHRPQISRPTPPPATTGEIQAVLTAWAIAGT